MTFRYVMDGDSAVFSGSSEIARLTASVKFDVSIMVDDVTEDDP